MLKIFTFFLISFSINAAASSIKKPTSEDFKSWVTFMASDEMKGRANGSEEIEVVAHWIASEFENAGLKNVPGMDDYFQSFQGNKSNPYRNVIAYLKGSNPKKAHEYIILSAHYDHIGLTDGVVNNGADDNASGVSTLLGLAHHLQQAKPERSVLFIAWSGEEEGMLGSKFYTEHPVLPLENGVLNVNFEMVGHTKGQGKKQFWVTGAKYSSLYEDLKQIGLERNWNVSPSPFPELNLFWRSDNVSFALLDVDKQNKTAYGIPAHSISTWGREGHYHSPADDIHNLDYDNLALFSETMSSMLVELAARPTVAQWRDTDDVTFKHYKAK